MTTDTNPTPEENEAFEAISRAQKHQRDHNPEPWLWLPEGEYTLSQLRQLVDSFEKMKTSQSALGGGH